MSARMKFFDLGDAVVVVVVTGAGAGAGAEGWRNGSTEDWGLGRGVRLVIVRYAMAGGCNECGGSRDSRVWLAASDAKG